MRAVVTYLLATGLLPRAPTIPPDGKQEGLSCAAFDIRNTDGTTDESNLAPTIASGGNSEGETEDISPSSNTPRDEITPIYGATFTAPPGTVSTPTRAAPPPRTQTRKQRDQGTPEPMFPTQEIASRQRQLLVRANINAHTQPRCNGSQTFSANRRNS